MASMNAYLLSGSNLGDRTNNIATAKKMITTSIGKVLRASSVYETAAWGLENQQPFFNQALLVETELSPVKLLHALKVIEKTMGRTNSPKWGPRIIDLDILLMDNLIFESPELTIPHPQLHNRRFTLVPLAEIADDVLHPKLNLIVSELLNGCKDELEVKMVHPVRLFQ